MNRQVKMPPPKPCPRCYAPMQRTSEGFSCRLHGVVEDHLAERQTKIERQRQVPKRQTRRARTPRAPKPRSVSQQTARLRAMQETILERNRAGESLAAIAADLWQELGYQDQHVAASKISRFLKLRGATAAAVRPGPLPGSAPTARYTPERLAQVHMALAAGTSVWAFAGLRWQEWGFPSRSACDSLIRKWLRTKSPAQGGPMT